MSDTMLMEALDRAHEIRDELVHSALDLLDPLDLIVAAAREHLACDERLIKAAVLGAKSGPIITDEMVERAAKAIASHHGIKPEIWELPEWKGDRLPWLRDARAALEAALTKEDRVRLIDEKPEEVW